jgi:PAS domain S-box-containing protein
LYVHDFVDDAGEHGQDIADPRFMRSVLAASDDCIKVLSLDGRLTFMSEGGRRVMEISDFGAVSGCPWPSFWSGDSKEHAVAAVAAAAGGRSYRFQGEANTGRGNPRWWDVKVSPILDDAGRPHSILSVSRDITDLKQAEQHQRLLALELKHRIKNSIAMVQAIANQTLRPGELTADAKAVLMERLRTMGDAQDLLTQEGQSRASLREVVTSALRPHDVAGRLSLQGPDLALTAKCALAMALALHELATNALKYGALSNAEGRIAVSWTNVADAGGQAMFTLQWRETGGPSVTSPERTGFGSRMIERALAGYFQGSAIIDYRPEGVVFTLQAPMEALTAD